MATEEQESGRGFRVQDRRRFSPDTGESRSEETDQKSEEMRQEEQVSSSNLREDQGTSRQSDEPISFSSFILGLVTQTLMFIGEVPSPPNQAKQVDLGAARQMIDLLAVLKEKTKGNLTTAEDSMLENALFDLRMRYVKIAKNS